MPPANPTAAWKHIPREHCPHSANLPAAAGEPKFVCEKCGHSEDLRRCLACGYVACCESHAAHNTEHFRLSGHALIRPLRCRYDWLWCYACNAFLE